VAFVSEQGKDLNKVVTFKASQSIASDIVEIVGGYRFCEFNKDGNLYAVRKLAKVGQAPDTAAKDLILTYESHLLCPKTGSILSSNTLLTHKNLKGL
jgi:hypothetical protein